VAGLKRTQDLQENGMGYFQLQTTKPQTVAYFLADSPVGLLAWIYEKLHDWTDDYRWTDEEICTWVTIYWFSRAGPAASVRIYYESMRGDLVIGMGGYLPNVKLVSHEFPCKLTTADAHRGACLFSYGNMSSTKGLGVDFGQSSLRA
jgi:hypothetical protein